MQRESETSAEEFRHMLFRHAGLEIAPEKFAELRESCVVLESFIERARACDEGEPSEIFAPIEARP